MRVVAIRVLRPLAVQEEEEEEMDPLVVGAGPGEASQARLEGTRQAPQISQSRPSEAAEPVALVATTVQVEQADVAAA